MEALLDTIAKNHGPEWVLILILVVRQWQTEKTLFNLMKQDMEVKASLVAAMKQVLGRLGIEER